MSYNKYDNENDDKYIRLLRSNRFYKWFSIISMILTTIALLNYCVFHYSYNDTYKKARNSFKNDQPKISAYHINLPSEYYEVTTPVTLRQLSKRWHVSIEEIRGNNDWLSNIPNNQPIHPSSGKGTIDVPSTTPSKPPNTSTDQTSYESEVLMLTNKERSNVGLKPLTVNSKLQQTARLKSQDMASKGYFDHTSPTYGSPFDMMKQFGITYSSAAENIAKGQKTPSEVVKAWMNSTGHRQNMLNPNFNQIGIGYDSNGSLWTQQFIQK